ncbi:MAG: hypothetical protein ACR2HV_07700 [Acidimicrobiales bacterium]
MPEADSTGAQAGDGATPPSGGLEIEVIPDETHEGAHASVTKAILRHPLLRRHFPAGDLWLLGFDLSDKDDGGTRFTTLVHDTTTGRAARVRGWLDDIASTELLASAAQWPPSDDEHRWAVSILREDPELGALLAAEGAYAYRPMPPLLNVDNADGTVDRVIAVGLRTVPADGHPAQGDAQAPADGRPAEEDDGAPAVAGHRIVGVRTGDAEIFRDPSGVARPSSADCGAPPGPSCEPNPGDRQARVRVRRGDGVLWDLVVVRPSASSGTNGSGVELRNVDYKGQRVLTRAHVPILNVAYGSDGAAAGCGPTYRDWQHEESCFSAPGADPVAGFRLCPSPAQTILETGTDGGDYRGVALWVDGDEVVIASQIQAGWYRYVSEWRLAADGTIRPRFGFAAARNPCTCQVHHHHAYWRFDFDILGAESNVVQEYNDPPLVGTSNWHTVQLEVRRDRSADHGRYWRVRNTRASQGYAIRPGPNDGLADEYGAGDVWILRYDPDEIDDGQGFTKDPVLSRANLDRMVSGESVERQDLVVWYAAHFRHEPGEDTDAGHRLGPDLVPYEWKETPVASAPFANLAPPTDEELQPPPPRE